MKTVILAFLVLAGCREVPRRATAERAAPPAGLPKLHRALPAPDFFEVSIRSTSCYGRCPVFTLTVSSPGLLTWQGDADTRVTGAASGKATPIELFLLDHAFRSARFSQLPNRDAAGLDCSSSFFSYRGPAGEKQVEHWNCNQDQPFLAVLREDFFRIARDRGWLENL